MKTQSLCLSALLLVCSPACKSEDSAPAEKAPGRFAAVKKAPARKAAKKFCDKVFDAPGKPWTRPPERDLPAPSKASPNPSGKAWTWINLWATWCGPCVEEMPLLDRWKSALAEEKLPLRMEMWTIDEEEQALKEALSKTYPGDVHWLRGEDDLPGLLSSLGLSQNTAIPVHALLDPAGNLRCVRVGKVGEANYAAIKAIVGSAI